MRREVERLQDLQVVALDVYVEMKLLDRVPSQHPTSGTRPRLDDEGLERSAEVPHDVVAVERAELVVIERSRASGFRPRVDVGRTQRGLGRADRDRLESEPARSAKLWSRA